MDIFKDVASIVGCISAVIALIGLFSTKIRSGVKNIFKKQTQDLANENASQNEQISELNDKIDSLIFDMKEFQRDTNTQLEIARESLKDVMRQKITAIYHRNCGRRKIPIYEKETVDEVFKDYKKYGGNGYLDKYYQRICNWEIMYTDDDKLD